MESRPDLDTDVFDHDSDLEVDSLVGRKVPFCINSDIDQKVRDLQTEVERLRECLHDSLDLQRNMLEKFDLTNKKDCDVPASKAPTPHPMATSTPYNPAVTRVGPTLMDSPSYVEAQVGHSDSFQQPQALDLVNTSRMIAAALHHAKLEPPVYSGDGKVNPEEWLQAVNTYKSSLNLTDIQILNELPHFLAKEPSTWFKALSSHVVTWRQFCQLFRTVFLPSDNQERVLRGILDRVQGHEEPLPTFVAHMLSEFKKLQNPPPEQEQIDLICKHSLEKYRVALFGTHIPSVIDLLLRAHELHSVLGPSGHQTAHTHIRGNQTTEPHCFKCSLPGFTSRTCPNCNPRPHMPPPRTQPQAWPAPISPIPVTPDRGEPKTDSDFRLADSPPYNNQAGNFRGGRTFRRGSPLSRR